MFEVGKKYQYIDTPHLIVDCVYVAPSLDYALLTMPDSGNPFVRYAGVFKHYREYVEPKKFTRYLNVYPDGRPPGCHKTRSAADAGADHTRIACIKMELTEGQFDV